MPWTVFVYCVCVLAMRYYAFQALLLLRTSCRSLFMLQHIPIISQCSCCNISQLYPNVHAATYPNYIPMFMLQHIPIISQCSCCSLSQLYPNVHAATYPNYIPMFMLQHIPIRISVTRAGRRWLHVLGGICNWSPMTSGCGECPFGSRLCQT